MEAILINAKGISNRIYYLIPDVRYKNQLEPKGINSIILKRIKGRSPRYNNTYKRYQQYKGAD